MKTIMSCLVLVAMAVFTSAAFAQEPTLTSGEVKFDTTTDNKDQETKLDVYVKTSDGQEVAKAEGNEGRWNKNSILSSSLMLCRRAASARNCSNERCRSSSARLRSVMSSLTARRWVMTPPESLMGTIEADSQ